MTSLATIYNTDWLFLSSGQAHVAKNQEWFKTYTACETTFQNILGGNTPVIGIGTVELELAPQTQDGECYILVLEHVLHAPGAEFNLVCFGLIRNPSLVANSDDSSMQLYQADSKAVRGMGKWIGQADCVHNLYSLRLRGQAPNTTSLLPGILYVSFMVLWSAQERLRCENIERRGQFVRA